MTVSQTDPSDGVTHLRSQVDRATDPRDRRRALVSLASVLLRKRAHHRSIAELEELIRVAAEIITLTPGHYRDRIRHVTGWAENIRLRSVTKMDATELGRAIDTLAPELTRERPDCPTWVHTHVIAAHFELVQCLRERFKLTGDVNDLETGLDTLDRAARIAPAPEMRQCHELRAGLLRFRFRTHGRVGDLDEAILAGMGAVAEARQSKPTQVVRCLLGVAMSLRIRHDWVNGTAIGPIREDGDLVTAQSCITEARNALGPGTELPAFGMGVAASIHRRSAAREIANGRGTDARDMIDEAIRLHELALASHSLGKGNHPWALTELAECYLLRYRFGQLDDDLEHAAFCARRAWKARSAQQSVGTLDTATVLVDILTELADQCLPVIAADHTGTGADLHAEIGACLKQANDVLDNLLASAWVGDHDVHQNIANRYQTLRNQLIDWHVRRATEAQEAGDASLAASHATEAHRAIERAKQRQQVAHMDAGTLRPDPLVATDVQKLRRVNARIEVMMVGAGDTDASGTATDTLGGRAGMGRNPRTSRAFQRSQALAKLLADRDRLQKRIMRSDPVFAQAKGFVQPANVDDIVASVPTGTTIVVLYPLETYTAVIGITVETGQSRVRPRVAKAPLKEPQTAALSRQVFAGSSISAPNLPHVLQVLSSRLMPAFAEVVPGWDRAVGSGPGVLGADTPAEPTHRLVIVPTGHLHRFPLHAMPINPDSQRGAVDVCLNDRFVISYASTTDILPRANRRVASADGVATVAPGVGTGTEGSETHIAVAFAQALAARNRGTAVVRNKATHQAVTTGSVLAGKRLGFVATHGRPGRETKAGILLHSGEAADTSGQWLVASDIVANLRLEDVDHLQLIACETHADNP
ncbi:MAG: CHAT domain-containing protein, partial [Chloroflexota bacterium]